MLSETWEDQYRRMHRSYERLKKSADEYIERDPELHSEANSRDILYHFCADAYHLKDYIKNSPCQTKAIMDAVEQLCDFRFPDASTALATCADIANGFKHLGRRTSKFPNVPAEIREQAAGIELPFALPAHFTYHFTIEANGQLFNERTLARDAVSAWDKWLLSQNFKLPAAP